MKIVEIRELELDNGEVAFIDLGKDVAADTVCEEVAIQLKSGSLSVTGKAIDDDNFSNSAVCAIKLSDMSKVSALSSAGIYLVPTEALSSITITASASSEAVVKVLA